ncbi:TPA: hypothetical protein ACH3X2_003692 [Trebouxia sp. C0005]
MAMLLKPKRLLRAGARRITIARRRTKSKSKTDRTRQALCPCLWNSVREKLKTYTAARNKDSAGVPVPSAYIKGLIAEGTSTAMAGLARQAVRDNDLVSAALYAEQANKHWLKHHAVVMQYSAQMRPALPPFPFPRRQPGPPLGFQ